jgi:hypothetical protein
MSIPPSRASTSSTFGFSAALGAGAAAPPLLAAAGAPPPPPPGLWKNFSTPPAFSIKDENIGAK